MKIQNAFRLGLFGGLGVLVAVAIGGGIQVLGPIITYVGAALFLALGIDPAVSWLERRNLLVFQSSGTPSVVVKVEESDQHDDQWEITILRSPFPFPKPDEGLATVAEGQPGKPPVKAEPRPAVKPAVPVHPAPNPQEQE